MLLTSHPISFICFNTIAPIITTSDTSEEDSMESDLIASICMNGVYILLVIVNIVFAVGVVFRHIRQMCCADCTDVMDDPYDPYLVRDTKM